MRAAILALLTLGAFAADSVLAVEKAFAIDPVKFICANRDDDVFNERYVKDFEYADLVLPNIPPEEEKYLAAEYAAAMKLYEEEQLQNRPHGQSTDRLNALQQRPLYDVWQVRKSVAVTRTALATVLVLQPHTSYMGLGENIEAEKLAQAIAATKHVMGYLISMREFLVHQSTTPNPIISSDQRLRIYASMLTMSGTLPDYMRCKLTKIMATRAR